VGTFVGGIEGFVFAKSFLDQPIPNANSVVTSDFSALSNFLSASNQYPNANSIVSADFNALPNEAYELVA
jgi:hypothetical protein